MPLELPSPPAADEPTKDWPRRRIQVFDVLSPYNVSFVMAEGPVSVTLWGPRNEVVRRYGHNRACWPVTIGRFGGRSDSGSKKYDTNPFYRMRTRFRIWARTKFERDRLADSIVDLIAERAEEYGGVAELLHGHRDVGPDFSPELFELECHDIARRLGIMAWDDAALVAFLDRVADEAARLAAKARGGKHSPVEVALGKAFDR